MRAYLFSIRFWEVFLSLLWWFSTFLVSEVCWIILLVRLLTNMLLGSDFICTPGYKKQCVKVRQTVCFECTEQQLWSLMASSFFSLVVFSSVVVVVVVGNAPLSICARVLVSVHSCFATRQPACALSCYNYVCYASSARLVDAPLLCVTPPLPACPSTRPSLCCAVASHPGIPVSISTFRKCWRPSSASCRPTPSCTRASWPSRRSASERRSLGCR